MGVALCASAFAFAQKPYNVLFIAIDDLRPDLGCYDGEIISPNIDKLASTGRTFTRHYVQVPTCGASRHSMLTSSRPCDAKFVQNHASSVTRANKPSNTIPESFPHLFKQNGYKTICISKISHVEEKNTDWKSDFLHSWDERYFEFGKWHSPQTTYAYVEQPEEGYGRNRPLPYEKGPEGYEYLDTLNAKLAISKLNELAKQDQPFLLAVGFVKPHLPFNSPKEFWDLYDEKDIKLPSPRNYPATHDKAFSMNSGEFNAYKDTKTNLTKLTSDELSLTLKHGYYAAASYTDSLVGKVLDELERLGLADNTIVVLWGDHGWQLGEYAMWGKHTLFNRALNSPLIIRTPNMKNAGVSTESLAESLDIYPTLAELCNLKAPESIHGTSLVKILEDPKADVKDEVFSYWSKGITVRNKDYSLMYTLNPRDLTKKSSMLFDNKKDFYQENELSKNPEFAQIKDSMLAKIEEHIEKFDVKQLKPSTEKKK